MLEVRLFPFLTLFGSILFLILVATPGQAAFVDIGTGARPMGLGGAFTALADDASALYYNNAGIAFSEAIQLHGTRVSHLGGLASHNFIAGILPVGKIGAFGISTNILSESEEIYQEQAIKLSYATSFKGKFSTGISVKRLRTTYNQESKSITDNPYFATYQTSALSADLGVLILPLSGLRVGMVAENLIPTNISISESGEDNVPINFRFGVAYDLDAVADTIQQESLQQILKTARGSAEVGRRNGQTAIKGGIEVWVNPTIGLRTGYALHNNQTGVISLGGSLRLKLSSTRLQFDYAYRLFSVELTESSNSQLFSLGVVF